MRDYPKLKSLFKLTVRQLEKVKKKKKLLTIVNKNTKRMPMTCFGVFNGHFEQVQQIIL